MMATYLWMLGGCVNISQAESGIIVPDTQKKILHGSVVDENNVPLVGVRIGIRGETGFVETDQEGGFVLPVYARPKVGADAPYATVEFDKYGYIGENYALRSDTKLDQSLRQVLHAAGVKDGRASFSVRLPSEIELPPLPNNSTGELLSPQQWAPFFTALRLKPVSGRSGQVTFEAFVPPDAGRVRAVFLMSGHGIGSVDPPRLRAFAARNQVALVAATGEPVQRGFHPAAIIDPYLERLGSMLSHPEIATVPIMTFGHSNGTTFSGLIASMRPDREIAWISYHSGTSSQLQFPGTERIPSLVMHGLLDPFFRNGQGDTVERLRRERNAAMTFTLEPYVQHFPVDKERSATWDFIAAYAEAALRIRLDNDGKLRPVQIEAGWLGTPYDAAAGGIQEPGIAPYGSYQGDRNSAVWLPDETFARIWQRYETTDPRTR